MPTARSFTVALRMAWIRIIRASLTLLVDRRLAGYCRSAGPGHIAGLEDWLRRFRPADDLHGPKAEIAVASELASSDGDDVLPE